LYQALTTLQHHVHTDLQQQDYGKVLQHLCQFSPSLNSFFDAVMVFVDDVTIQNNRVALVYKIQNLYESVLDFSKLQVAAP